MSELISNISDQDFETIVLASNTPVLVDFWAEWCGPCKAITPILEEVALSYQEKLKVVKVNIDDNVSLPQKYGVRGIPTLILFNNGNVVDTKVGSLSKSQLTTFIDTNL